MIAQGPTHRDAAPSEEKLSQESRRMSGRSPRPESEALDLARLTPQQIAAELARRSQGLRMPTDTAAERAELAADASSRNDMGRDASPFARLTQVLSPRETMPSVPDARAAAARAAEERAAEERAAEERAAERRRLKEQYVLERYRHEEEHDIREAARRAAENAGKGRAEHQISGSHPSADDLLKGERRITDYAHHAMPGSVPSLSASAAMPDEPVRPNAAQTTPIDRLGAGHSSLAASESVDGTATGREIGQHERGTEAYRAAEANRSEARWGELRATELRAPEDIRNLVTTSFDRPMKPATDRHRHGVLLLAAAFVAGLALYFHPWLGPGEGRLRSDLPADRAAPVQPKPGGTAAIPPASTAVAKTSAAKPAADLPQPAPQAVPATPEAAGSGTASAPPPAVEMTPLSAQPIVPPASPGLQPSATGNSAAPVAPPASAVAPPPSAAASPAAPQSATAGVASSPPVSSSAAAKPTAGERGSMTGASMTTAPGAARPPEIKRAAKPVESDPGQSAVPQKAKEAYIKPSPAWLRVQPYDPGATATPEPAESTPDAWMKPRPYNPGVLIPPGN